MNYVTAFVLLCTASFVISYSDTEDTGLVREKRHLKLPFLPPLIVVNKHYTTKEEDKGHRGSGWGAPPPPPPEEYPKAPVYDDYYPPPQPPKGAVPTYSNPEDYPSKVPEYYEYPDYQKGWSAPSTTPEPPRNYGWSSSQHSVSWNAGHDTYRRPARPSYTRYEDEEPENFGIVIFKRTKSEGTRRY